MARRSFSTRWLLFETHERPTSWQLDDWGLQRCAVLLTHRILAGLEPKRLQIPHPSFSLRSLTYRRGSTAMTSAIDGIRPESNSPSSLVVLSTVLKRYWLTLPPLLCLDNPPDHS